MSSARSGAIDLALSPLLGRVAASHVWLVRSEVHQMFGRYHGAITTAEGEIIPIHDLVGWAEDHIARW